MNNLTVISDYTILDDYKYKIFFDEKNIYKAEVDFYSPFINFLKGREIYHSKISVTSSSKDEIIKIYKHHSSLLKDTLFTIFIKDDSYFVRNGKNLKIPDLYIRTNFGKLTIGGTINSQEFEVLNKDKLVAKIKGNLEGTHKIYNVNYKNLETIVNGKELLLSIILILDNMYHHY